VFDMTAKPNVGGVLLISTKAIIGIALGLPAWTAQASTSEVGP
jgi:hypothetical protein